MNEQHAPWELWDKPRRLMGESRLLRYGIAVILPGAAAVIVYNRPAFNETLFFIFLAAVVFSALNGGLAPAFISTALSSVLIRVLFVQPGLSLSYRGNPEGMERMVGFMLVAMLLSSFIADLRSEINLLRDSEKRYRVLAETASDAIIAIDEQGEILYVNPVSKKVFGAKSGQMVGKNLNLLLPGEGFHAKLAEMKRHLDTRHKAAAVQLPAIHQSGQPLLVKMTLGSASHRGKSIFTAIIRDVTGRQNPA